MPPDLHRGRDPHEVHVNANGHARHLQMIRHPKSQEYFDRTGSSLRLPLSRAAIVCLSPRT